MTNDWGTYKNAGAPEGVVTGNIGSICCDTTNGNVYKKSSGTGNTGWNLLAESTNTYSFLGRVSTPVNSVTGDGTEYQIINYIERYDLGNAFNATTGVFTAPEAGNYQFTADIDLLNVQPSNNLSSGRFVFSVVPLGIDFTAVNAGNVRQGNGNWLFNGTAYKDLALGETVHVSVRLNSSGKVVNLNGAWFGGHKIS